MIVKCPGHLYQLAHLDGDSHETVQFVDRGHGDDKEGTNNQEVLRMLINRIIFLNVETPWKGNEQILEHLRKALALHESRHFERMIEKGYMIEHVCVGDNGHFKLNIET